MSLFGALVAIVEALNGLGVAFTSNPSSSPSTQELGNKLTKASLAFQLAVITVCFILAVVFYRNFIELGFHNRNIKTPLTVLSLSMFLILVRCIYHLIEHVGNVRHAIDNLSSMKRLTPLLRYEWYFYVFEATIMLLNSAAWNLWHPGRYLPRYRDLCLSADGMEVRAEEDLDDRPLLVKAGSVLTFGIFFRQRKTARQQNFALESSNSHGSLQC